MRTPICLFTYNRLYETRQTVEALKQNFLASESELYVFSDGSKNDQEKSKVDAVRQYLQTISGFKSVQIIESAVNKGLANSIINGVSQIVQQSGNVIVLEDDLITTPNFLNFMNQALDFYRDDQNIQSISGYSLFLKDKSADVYFQTRPGSWGWATWNDRWDKEIFDKKNLKKAIDLDRSLLKEFKLKCGSDIPRMLTDSISGKNDSWYVRWAFDHYRKNRYTVYPAWSYVTNIGHQQANATHCKGINTYKSELVDERKISTQFLKFQIPSKPLSNEFLTYFTRWYKLVFRIKLLKTKTGRALIRNEIKSRLG